MTCLLTGATGYIGSYVAAEFLRDPAARLAVLVRAADDAAARRRLWRAWQPHMAFDAFLTALERVDIYRGDLRAPGLGLSDGAWQRLAHATGSVVHAGAALNRRAFRICAEVNVHGTVEVAALARAAHAHHGLSRFTFVSSVAAAGLHRGRVVHEDDPVAPHTRGGDPYALSKAIGERVVRSSLHDVQHLIVRPSAVLGDSRHVSTTQFDIARALVLLARSPAVPLGAAWRVDVVPADYVARSIVTLHLEPCPAHRVYHLSAGADAPTFARIAEVLRDEVPGLRPRFLPALRRPLDVLLAAAGALPARWPTARAGALLRVLMPYVTADAVYDNTRATRELGERPEPFVRYARALYRFLVRYDCRYPYLPWPGDGRRRDDAARAA